MSAATALSTPDEAILDTNVVLDWLLFEDPVGRIVGAEVVAGRLRWIGTAAMLDELSTVLSRPGLERWDARNGLTLSLATAHCRQVEAPPIARGRSIWCADPDDQKFVDLALYRSTRWLFSRDKALLRLARKAKLHGVSVLRPVDWPLTSNAPQGAHPPWP